MSARLNYSSSECLTSPLSAGGAGSNILQQHMCYVRGEITRAGMQVGCLMPYTHLEQERCRDEGARRRGRPRHRWKHRWFYEGISVAERGRRRKWKRGGDAGIAEQVYEDGTSRCFGDSGVPSIA